MIAWRGVSLHTNMYISYTSHEPNVPELLVCERMYPCSLGPKKDCPKDAYFQIIGPLPKQGPSIPVCNNWLPFSKKKYCINR